MIAENLQSPPRLAWQLHDREVARERLTQARFPTSPSGIDSSDKCSEVGILYAYGSGPSAEIVTWIQPTEPRASRHLRKETEISNGFDQWLERVWPISIWHMATAWALYEQWLTHGGHVHWQATLRRRFKPVAFLDQLLEHSSGWLLWCFQLEMVIFAATDDVARATEFAKQWRLQSPTVHSTLDGLVLPNGLGLRVALEERAYRLDNHRVIVLGRPNIPVAARIHSLYIDLLG
ncbi:MAG TPA: hypothetical protein VGH81_13860 [Rudaea sp.]|jgi:hypothetical protein